MPRVPTGRPKRHDLTPTSEPFAKAARSLVARDGRTLRVLAEQLPFGYPYLSRLLTGEKQATIPNIEAVAEALAVPGSYFVEVRLQRIAEYLRTHPRRCQQLWEELPVNRD
jgi:transcriptional regulator with XRE-family HTH domain